MRFSTHYFMIMYSKVGRSDIIHNRGTGLGIPCRRWRSTVRPYAALTALRFFGSGCFAFLHVSDVCFTASPVLVYYHMPVVRMGFRKGTWSVLTEAPVVCTLCECLLRSTFDVVSRASAFGAPPSAPSACVHGLESEEICLTGRVFASKTLKLRHP